MSELDAKLAQLEDSVRARLYRELLDRLDETAPANVQELVLVYENNVASNLQTLKETVERLPEHERPTRFIATEKLPTTSHGKLDRRGLPGLIRKERTGPHNSVAIETASDPFLSSAIETFGEVLGNGPVGPDSNFFEIGGHSLLAVECILAFEEKSGQRISITQFLNHPTPRGIATLLRKQNTHAFEYIYPVSDYTTGLPVLVFSASRLAYALKNLRPDWSIYGVHLRWRDDNDEEIRYRNLEDMASRIADEISRLADGKDFILAGSSFPAMLAFEVAKQLKARATTPGLTILIEPSLWPGIRTWIEQDLDYHGHLRQGDNHYLKWLAVNSPFTSRFWRRLNRLASSRQNTTTPSAEHLKATDEHKAYETGRTTALWRGYSPSVYDGPSILIAGAESGWQYDRDWVKCLGQLRAVHNVDADHEQILKDPFMSDVVIPILSTEVDASLQPGSSATGSAEKEI